MATIGSIIAAFLTDLTNAQHQANKRSAHLSRQYRDGPILQFFPVPNALLEEADVTLHFSVDSIEPAEMAVSGLAAADNAMPPPRIVVSDIASGIATLVLAELRNRILTDAEAGNHAVAMELRRQLWRPAIRRTLMRNLTLSLHPLLTQFRMEPPEPGSDLETRVALQEALEATFGDDQDLAASIGAAHEWADQLAQGDIGKRAAASLADAASAGVTDADGAAAPATAHVQLRPHLDDIPEYLVQSVRIRAQLRNYKWVIVDDDHAQLLPES